METDLTLNVLGCSISPTTFYDATGKHKSGLEVSLDGVNITELIENIGIDTLLDEIDRDKIVEYLD